MSPVWILVKVTIIAVVSLAGARLARRSRAAVRHALLAAAFGVMLVLPVGGFVARPSASQSPSRHRIGTHRLPLQTPLARFRP